MSYGSAFPLEESLFPTSLSKAKPPLQWGPQFIEVSLNLGLVYQWFSQAETRCVCLFPGAVQPLYQLCRLIVDVIVQWIELKAVLFFNFNFLILESVSWGEGHTHTHTERDTPLEGVGGASTSQAGSRGSLGPAQPAAGTFGGWGGSMRATNELSL